ncbi:MAG: efflux RND transporter periplasmic adaptor subunit [Chromatiales bacterium]|nr:efflux RND transporter periplasmic adaptor subunit [Chromatiales bacterium]MDH4013313.1 efflux RND transporter periplasmic adaptor subunit [Chromatiales bacterium]
MISQNRITILLLSLLFVVTGCAKPGEEGANNPDTEKEEEEQAIPVEIATLQRGDVYAVYSGTASIEAFGEAMVEAKVGGEVRELLVEEGDVVKSGQILARLDGDRLRLELQQSIANMNKLQREYDRNVELHQKGLVSPGAFENIKYDLQALRATNELAQLELSYTDIRAPIDGVVSERYIKVGNTIDPNDATFKVTDLDPLIIYLHVPERDYRQLQAGQNATILVDALKGKQFDGVVARVSPVIDAATGTFKVTIEVPDQSGQLKPGMFGRINIVYDMHANALQLPRSAVVGSDDEPAVFVVEDDVVRRQVVALGFSSGARVEVLDGLTGTERIVVVGQTGLRDGTRVEVVNADGASTASLPAQSE